MELDNEIKSGKSKKGKVGAFSSLTRSEGLRPTNEPTSQEKQPLTAHSYPEMAEKSNILVGQSSDIPVGQIKSKKQKKKYDRVESQV